MRPAEISETVNKQIQKNQFRDKQIRNKRAQGLLEKLWSVSTLFDVRCMGCGNVVSAKILPGLAFNALCEDCTRRLSSLKFGFCKSCALPFAEGSTSLGPCQACLLKKPEWRAIYFIGLYRGLLKDLILDLKYHSSLFVGPLLGQLLAKKVEEQLGTANYDAVIPVPVHVNRLKKRGFNQSLELSRPIAKTIKAALRADLFLRIKDTVPQEQLSRKERQKVVIGVFSASPKLKGLRLLLVDDVMTTGATIRECTGILLKAGAASVDVAVVARTELE